MEIHQLFTSQKKQSTEKNVRVNSMGQSLIYPYSPKQSQVKSLRISKSNCQQGDIEVDANKGWIRSFENSTIKLINASMMIPQQQEEQSSSNQQIVVQENIVNSSNDQMMRTDISPYTPMPLHIQLSNSTLKKEFKNEKSSPKSYISEIDRKLAVFYHPLIQEITNIWIKVCFGERQQRQLNFMNFTEINLRLQRALLAKFDLSNAFVSSVKDWIKEINDYYQTKQEKIEVQDFKIELLYNKIPFVPSIQLTDYRNFFDQQVGKDIHLILQTQITSEVMVKFLFDLCQSWCQCLDIELYAYFLISLLMQISQGESLEASKIQTLQYCELLPEAFLEDFSNMVREYQDTKKKNLFYYRKWCEYNYLRIDSISENIMEKLMLVFPDDKRPETLVEIFTKVFSLVYREISRQKNSSELRNDADQQIWYNDLVEQLRPVQHNTDTHFRIEKIQKQLPEEFYISYNENEKAFILQRKVKLPIVGTKLQIPQITPYESIQQKKNIAQGRKEVYVYYVQDQPTMEEKAEIISNIHKPIRLPLFNRTKNQQKIEPHKIDQEKKKISKHRQNLNNSFSYPQKQPPSQFLLEPDFLRQADADFQKNKTHHSDRNPISLPYKTQYKTWEHYSNDIGVRRRDIKQDVPKEIQQGAFVGSSFNKIVLQRDPLMNLGKINKIKPKIHKKQTPLENERIAKVMQNEYYSDSFQVSDTHQNQNAQGCVEFSYDVNLEYTGQFITDGQIKKQQNVLEEKQYPSYGLHNVNLTFEQWDSLQQNRHLWSPLLSLEEVKILRQNDNQFYHILQLLKLKFNQDHKSEYIKQLRLDFNYASRRDELGGVITHEDQIRFHERIQRLIERDRKRKERRKKKRRGRTVQIGLYYSKPQNWDIKTNFKNKQSRVQYREMFIRPLKNQK